MSIPLTINGVTFQYPQQGDTNWGPVLTNWSSAVTSGMLQKAGGPFTLTSEVDFGASFGIKVASIKSEESNIATTGYLRLGNASPGIVWRNAGHSGDLPLTVNSSNQLVFNGSPIGATVSLTDGHIFVGNASNQPADVAMSGDIGISNAGVTAIQSGVIVDADINASAAIALSKLASTTQYFWYVANITGVLTPVGVTASKAVITDANGLPSASSVTSTELGYLSGATNPIQTQINAKLNLSGGTMSGILNMGANKIQAVTQGSSSGEALSYPASGSTANSGGSAGQLSQGTISSPDFRANAVTLTASSLASTFGLALHSAASCSITTIGKPVLIHYSITFSCQDLFASNPLYRASIFQDSTEIAGGQQSIQLKSATGASGWLIPVSGHTIVTPSAGSHTYDLSAISTVGASTIAASVSNATIIAIELRA